MGGLAEAVEGAFGELDLALDVAAFAVEVFELLTPLLLAALGRSGNHVFMAVETGTTCLVGGALRANGLQVMWWGGELAFETGAVGVIVGSVGGGVLLCCRGATYGCVLVWMCFLG